MNSAESGLSQQLLRLKKKQPPKTGNYTLGVESNEKQARLDCINFQNLLPGDQYKSEQK